MVRHQITCSFCTFHYFETSRKLRVNCVRVDPQTTALKEINKHDTYIITFTHGIRTNYDNNNKNAWCKKKKGNFIHSIKPHYSKSPCSKK